jgi:probable rRNA maturation factor
MKIEIEIDHRQKLISLTKAQEKSIHDAVAACYEMEGVPEQYEVSLSFVLDEEIRELNRVYRGKDQPTDVLSFPMENKPDSPVKLLGDIVISVEKMIKQADEYGHSLDREMIYLVVHSVLHLLGYDHMDETDKEVMRRKEETVMSRMALTR